MADYRLLVTGSRYPLNKESEKLVEAAVVNQWWYALDYLDVDRFVLVHGGATGVDAIAAGAASLLNDLAAVTADMLPVIIEEHPAEWAKYGRQAGPKRNREMVAAGADLVMAFPLALSDGESKGTLHCIKEATKAGLPVVVTPVYREYR